MATPNPSPLLRLPAEIRHKIWTFTIGNQSVVPLASSLPRRSSPPAAPDSGAAYDSSCYTCSRKNTNPDPIDPHTVPISTAVLPLLACRQIYTEAVALFQKTLTVHASLTSELQLPRSQACAQRFLRHMELRIHFGVSRDADVQEDMRHLWLSRLSSLAAVFPALKTLHVTVHLRPPIAYENLIDAVYFAGPLSHLPARIRLVMEFGYVAEDVMIDHPELGQVWYSDALGEHVKVIEDCMGDEMFRRGFLNQERSLDVMTGRLLEISQEHERPWLIGLRARNVARMEREFERRREEARMNARMNGCR